MDNEKKVGKVYMANADSKKLATWIITTCLIVTNKLEKQNTDFLINSIKKASEGQFPVKGIVYENMDGKGYFPYKFKDGVTVFLRQNSDSDFSLINDGNIRSTGKYARIISTTRENYNSLFKEKKTEGLKWLEVVRKEYQLALKSDVNQLMVAWAKGKLR